MDGGGSIGNGGHHLAEGLGPHIADGVDAGNAGLCGFSGSDIARLIQLQLALKQAGGGLAAPRSQRYRRREGRSLHLCGRPLSGFP